MAYSQQTRAPNDASRTVTITPTPAPEEQEQPPQEIGSIRVRAGRRQRPHVVWDEAFVDNEGAGKKKSKSECGLRSMDTSPVDPPVPVVVLDHWNLR